MSGIDANAWSTSAPKMNKASIFLHVASGILDFTGGGEILILVKVIPKKVVIFDNHYYLPCGIT